MSKRISFRKLAILFVVVYLLSLIPILIISFYNYPSADDFNNSVLCYQAWEQTGSVFEVLAAAWERTVYEWQAWRGVFLSAFLSALSPNLWGEEFYFLTPWLVLLVLSLGTVYFLHTLFVKVFHAEKYISLCVSMPLLFVTVQCMVGKTECIFWHSGAINYTFLHGMSLFFYGLLLSLVCGNTKERMKKLIPVSVLGFLLGGSNQMTMLNIAIVLVSAEGILLVTQKWETCKRLAIPGLFFLTGMILNVAAPGNRVRAASTDGMPPLKAILESLRACLQLCVGEWTNWIVILLILALVPFFWHMAGKTEFTFPHPVLAVLYGYGLVSAMLTPPLYATGNLGSERLQGMTYIMYLLVLVLCEGYVVGRIEHKWKELRKDEDSRLKGMERLYLIGCLVLFLTGTGYMLYINPHYYTFSSAITDMNNGKAAAYQNATRLRTKLYRSGEKNVVAEPFREVPELLFFSDIKTDPEEWDNQSLARYYGLESVRVKE